MYGSPWLAIGSLPSVLLMALDKKHLHQLGALTRVDTFTGRVKLDVRCETRERIEPARWRGLA